MAKKQRLHVFWSGRVQGVGFRYATESSALDLHLTGWVRNLPDGRVETVAEGSEKSLKRFLEEMASGSMKTYIQKTQLSWSMPTGEFDDFQIRFY